MKSYICVCVCDVTSLDFLAHPLNISLLSDKQSRVGDLPGYFHKTMFHSLLLHPFFLCGLLCSELRLK